MFSDSDHAHLSLHLLAARCAEETNRFVQRLTSNSLYCFELLRRALAERSNEALAHIYTIYLPLLKMRAYRHAMFEASCQDSDYFARIALANFYRTCQGDRFLMMFPALPAAIAYLYTCLHSAIVQDVRDNPPVLPVPDTLADESDKTEINSTDLWAHICSVLNDPVDERLAYLRFVMQMPPAEIVQHEPERWHSEREVSVALQRIRRRLRSDATLRDLVGLKLDDQAKS